MMDEIFSNFQIKLIILILLIGIISRLHSQQCSRTWDYEIIESGGPPLPDKEVISSHNVQPAVQLNCNFLCYEDRRCVGFNFQTKNKDVINCQLTNTTVRSNNVGSGDWTLFHKVRVGYGRDCSELYRIYGERTDGVYEIDPGKTGSFKVFCDMTTSGGGWTVIQRRLTGSVDFYRGWQDYKNGFGDVNGEYWLGLDRIHRMTTALQNELRIDMEDTSGNTKYAQYNTFAVGSEQQKYILSIGGYAGTAGDSLSPHKGMAFTTKNRDNDADVNNCAVVFKGAWWYSSCHSSNLNGKYLYGKHSSYANGINWLAWKGYYYSLKSTSMKIRPRAP
ncbi:microfibril-associated glycoprotein 4-like [Dendronephthya gigantea]|uniref:microfibril-associated glycoprotein 4-like n=1 Tax=Dendronephthya gigantea TaxID=151771 RepID=UPI001069F815|nr:microfibril-associated glycoprotein 4-like [Dendronephthya gigantea]